MAIKFTVEITREDGEKDSGLFCASSADASGSDVIFAGYGETPYDALHMLINELDSAELYRPD